MTVEKPHDTGLPPGITIDDYGQIKRQDTYRDLESEVLGVQAASLAKSLQTIGGYIEANLECGQFHNVARAITLAATVTEAANHAWENSSIAQPIDKTQGFWPDADILPGFDEGQWRRVEYLPESSGVVVQKVVQPEVIPSEELRESVEISGEPTHLPTGQIYQAPVVEKDEVPLLVSLPILPQPELPVNEAEGKSLGKTDMDDGEKNLRSRCPDLARLLDNDDYWIDGTYTARGNIVRLLEPRDRDREWKQPNVVQFFNSKLLLKYVKKIGQEEFGVRLPEKGKHFYITKDQLLDFLNFAREYAAKNNRIQYELRSTRSDMEFVAPRSKKKLLR